MRFPSKKQWARIFKVLNRKEKTALLALFSIFVGSSLVLLVINTGTMPARGGKYIEGMVGSPRFINPIYAQGSDVDRSLVELIFSGLMKYDGEGKIVPDLVETLEI